MGSALKELGLLIEADIGTNHCKIMWLWQQEKCTQGITGVLKRGTTGLGSERPMGLQMGLGGEEGQARHCPHG